jgi:transcriptional regulator with XRE-family HTH domain
MGDVEVGAYIKERREALHLTQEQFVEKLKAKGIDRAAPTLSKWEHGRAHISADYLPAIAEILGESVIKLYVLSGLLDTAPVISNLLLLLNTLPEKELDRIEKVINAMLDKDGA